MTAADTGVPRCSVMIPLELWSAPVLVQCPEPAVGYWTGRCPCGHVRDGWLCEVHAALSGEGGCRACLELADGPHNCPLRVSRVTHGEAP
jgi:hypothetical protein